MALDIAKMHQLSWILLGASTKSSNNYSRTYLRGRDRKCTAVAQHSMSSVSSRTAGADAIPLQFSMKHVGRGTFAIGLFLPVITMAEYSKRMGHRPGCDETRALQGDVRRGLRRIPTPAARWMKPTCMQHIVSSNGRDIAHFFILERVAFAAKCVQPAGGLVAD
jgi:hypothetical protein